jgi:hypothetical protein
MSEEKKEEYKISPMHRHLTQVVWYQLARDMSPSGRDDNSGTLHRLKWLFKPEDFPCGACDKIDTIKFMVLPTGVYRTCSWEGFTEKTDPVEIEGQRHMEAILLEDIICTNEQAIDVVKRYKQEKIYDPRTGVFFPPYRIPSHVGKIKCKLSQKAE